MGKLTIWNKKNEIVVREETPPATERSFEDTMQALKAASGKVEHRIIPMRCAKTLKPFAIICKRAPDEKRFTLEKIATEIPATTSKKGVLAKHFSGGSGTKAAFDAAEFNLAKWDCPWCGDYSGTVNCGHCQVTYCGGTKVRHDDGRKTYTCAPGCPSTGQPLQDSFEVRAHKAKSLAGKKARPALESPKESERLPYFDVKLLPKK